MMTDILKQFNANELVSKNMPAWVELIQEYSSSSYDDEMLIDHITSQVWREAREHSEIPVFANIIQSVVLERLKNAIIGNAFKKQAPSRRLAVRDLLVENISWSLDKAETLLYIGDKVVNTKEDIISAVETLIAKSE